MTTTPYETAIGIPRDLREQVVTLLNQQLADAIDLGLQLKHAHWNVKGPQFISLHELFDDLAEELEAVVDDIAERAVELGGVAFGTLQALNMSTRLPAFPDNAVSGDQHCAALRTAIGTFAVTIRLGIENATRCGDPATADLFTEGSRCADKMLWKVEAHLQTVT